MITRLLLVVWLTSAAADATGTWTLHLNPDFSGHQAEATCTFKQEGRKLTGTCGDGDGTPLTGEVNERRLRWTVKTGAKGELTAAFTAALDDRSRTMTGGRDAGGTALGPRGHL